MKDQDRVDLTEEDATRPSLAASPAPWQAQLHDSGEAVKESLVYLCHSLQGSCTSDEIEPHRRLTGSAC